jgi:hypothetical protein
MHLSLRRGQLGFRLLTQFQRFIARVCCVLQPGDGQLVGLVEQRFRALPKFRDKVVPVWGQGPKNIWGILGWYGVDAVRTVSKLGRFLGRVL